MILLLEILAALAIIAGVAILLTGNSEGMSDEPPDRADTGIPGDRAMAAADIDGLRFALAFRGYRMDEVDEALDRVRVEIGVRDELIRELETRVSVMAAAPEPEPAPDPPTPEPAWQPVAEPETEPEGEPAAPTIEATPPAPPVYDPWNVAGQNRYTQPPTYIDVEHDDEPDSEDMLSHQLGHAPALEPHDEPDSEDQPDDPPPYA